MLRLRPTVLVAWLLELIETALERLRLRLARPDALIQLAVFGVFTGLLAGGVVVALRLVIDLAAELWMPRDESEFFEGLPPEWRLALPVLGALAIWLLFRAVGPARQQVGVVHTLIRLDYHQGRMPMSNAVVQFIASIISILAGHSVGREGPAIHLGAAAGSGLAQLFGLPNNSMRLLLACGAAAGIAASFNTPLAGVIFALEVIMLNWSLASFVPVILAAVSATTLSTLFFGVDPTFNTPGMRLGSPLELSLILVMGVLLGVLAALFVRLLLWAQQIGRETSMGVRLATAGLGMGLMGYLVPEVMGLSYDTVASALTGRIEPLTLLLVLAAKLIATVFCLGLGVPGGLIGPTVVLGACLGGAWGWIGGQLFPSSFAENGLYALLGLAALLGAVLQAPLAALTAAIEMSYNPAIVVPAMVAILTASLTSRVLFGYHSVFQEQLNALGLSHESSPITNALGEIGVATVMDRSFAEVGTEIQAEAARTLLANVGPRWLVIKNEQRQIVALMPAVDLARHLREAAASERISLLDIPAGRLQVMEIHLHDSLREAAEKLRDGKAEALIVTRMTVPPVIRLYGVITHEHLVAAYR